MQSQGYMQNTDREVLMCSKKLSFTKYCVSLLVTGDAVPGSSSKHLMVHQLPALQIGTETPSALPSSVAAWCSAKAVVSLMLFGTFQILLVYKWVGSGDRFRLLRRTVFFRSPCRAQECQI